MLGESSNHLVPSAFLKIIYLKGKIKLSENTNNILKRELETGPEMRLGIYPEAPYTGMKCPHLIRDNLICVLEREA